MRQLLMRRSDLAGLPALELPGEVTLRDAKAADGAELSRLLETAFGDPSWTLERVNRALLEAPDVVRTLLLCEDGEIVATASARLAPDRFPGSGYLHWVAADPVRAGRGRGRTISLAVLHVFAELGCRDAVLETDDHRLPAIRTYLNLGFTPEDADPSHPERWQAIRERCRRENRRERMIEWLPGVFFGKRAFGFPTDNPSLVRFPIRRPLGRYRKPGFALVREAARTAFRVCVRRRQTG